jgi:hypothetical protein
MWSAAVTLEAKLAHQTLPLEPAAPWQVNVLPPRTIHLQLCGDCQQFH